MKAQLALCMKYMPAACMKSLTLTHEGWEFGFADFQFIGLYMHPRGRKKACIRNFCLMHASFLS